MTSPDSVSVVLKQRDVECLSIFAGSDSGINVQNRLSGNKSERLIGGTEIISKHSDGVHREFIDLEFQTG